MATTYVRAHYERRLATGYFTRERRFIAGANQHARRLGLSERLSFSDIDRLPTGPCFYCGDPDPREWDHRIALAVGGPNRIENLVRCCRTCNQRKAHRPESYLLVPEYIDLTCGWCWAPMRLRLADVRKAERKGRRHFTCSLAHRNQLHGWRRRFGDLRRSA